MTNPPTPPLTPNFNPNAGARLATDRFDFAGHVDGYSFRHQAGQIDLNPTVDINGVVTNVQDAIVALKNALTVPIIPDATNLVKGVLKLSGDLGGTAAVPLTVGLHGFPLSALTPVTNNVLMWSGAVWQPTALGSSLTITGDVTGTIAASVVAQIQGRPVSASSPSTGFGLIWNGSAWTPTRSLPTGTGLLNMTGGTLDSTATANVRYTGGKLQTDANLQFNNAGTTGDLSWIPSSSNKTLTLPNATDTLVGQATTDSLTNKTIVAASNTITDTSAALGDVLAIVSGTKFTRLAKGSNGTFLGVSAGALGYFTPSTSLGITGTGFVTATSGVVDPSATANIRYTGGKLQSDTNIQFKNGSNIGDLSWVPTTTRTLTLPDATDTIVGRATTDTLLSKTINATSNSITDNSQALGDLLKNNGSSFVRFPKGGSLQVLRVNSGATDLEWATISSGGSSSGVINTVQTSNGTGAFLGATGVLAGSNFLSAGTTPSASGFFRVPNGTGDTILGAKDNGGTDVNVISRPATNSFLFGNQTNQADVTLAGATTNIQATAQVKIFAPSDLTNPAITVSGTGTVVMNPHAFSGFTIGPNVSSSGAIISLFGGVSGPGSSEVKYIGFGSSGTPPTGTPVGGGYLYVDTGALKYKGTSGTLTTVGPADPHCKKCGRDFMHEWQNDNFGKLATCMPCLLDALAAIGVDVDAFSERDLNS